VLQEQYYLLKENCIKLFGERVKAIKEELDKRELKDIPTERLFDLFTKYVSALKQEGVEMVFQEEEDVLRAFSQNLKKVNSWSA